MQNVKRTHRHAAKFTEALNIGGNRARESIEQIESAWGGRTELTRFINKLYILNGAPNRWVFNPPTLL